MKSILFLFLLILLFLQSSQDEQTAEQKLQAMLPYCVPTPQLLNIQEQYGLPNPVTQDCRGIEVYPLIISATGRSFKCCEVSLKKKSGSGVSPINGCIAIMSSYIDDDRYEDMIDYFERGKQYKLQNYFVMLGYRTFVKFNYSYLPLVNGSKYVVEKLDCFSEYKWINIVLILVILILIY